MRLTILATITLLPLARPVLSQTPAVPPSETTLDINAEGHSTRVPDVAMIRAGVVSQGVTAAGALDDNARRMTRVMAALTHAGIAPRDVTTANVGLAPQYRYVDNQPPVLTGYQATNSVAIRFHAIGKAGAILDALVAEGANQIDGPSLSIDRPDAALDEARSDALHRARARADLYAKVAGLRVLRIVSIAESGENAGGANPPMMFARAVMAKDATPIAAGERDVTVTLSVRFLLE